MKLKVLKEWWEPIQGTIATQAINMVKKNYIFLCAFICISIIFFLTRFYNIDKRIGFDWDQEKISYDVKDIIVNHKFTLLGPRANNDKGFFLGPHLTYLLVPFYFATNLYPSALMYFVIVYCIVFFIATYLILKQIYNKKVALLFLSVWAIHTLLIEADISPFWPVLIPLGVMLILFFLHQIYNYSDKLHNWLLLGLSLGFILNIHFQSVFLLGYVCFFLFLSRKKIKISFIKMSSLILGILIMFSPLLMFDIRHNFFNISLFFRFFSENNTSHLPDFTAWIPVFSHIATPFVFIKNEFIAGPFFYILILILTVFHYYKKNGFMKPFYTSFLILWLLFPFLFALYGKRPSEYYFSFLYPFIIVSMADFYFSKKYHYFFIFYLCIYVIFNTITIPSKLNTFGINFYEKDRAIKRISQVLNNKKCDIAFNVPWGIEVGYKYLFYYYKIKQIGNWKSCVININIPIRPGDEKFGYLGVTFPKDLTK